MKSNYRMKKTLRQLDRFFCDLGDRIDEGIGKVIETDTFEKVAVSADEVAQNIEKFTKKIINKIVE